MSSHESTQAPLIRISGTLSLGKKAWVWSKQWEPHEWISRERRDAAYLSNCGNTNADRKLYRDTCSKGETWTSRKEWGYCREPETDWEIKRGRVGGREVGTPLHWSTEGKDSDKIVMKISWISSSHSGDYDEYYLLGCEAVWRKYCLHLQGQFLPGLRATSHTPEGSILICEISCVI
jgi:hypothetical protein